MAALCCTWLNFLHLASLVAGLILAPVLLRVLKVRWGKADTWKVVWVLDPGELALIDEVLLGAKRRGVDVVRALDAGGWILGRQRVRELEAGVLEAKEG